ncbi:MAG: DUF4352 domain-containing protein [Thermoleophilia bacterium]
MRTSTGKALKFLIVVSIFLLAISATAGCGGDSSTTGAADKTTGSQGGTANKSEAKVLTIGEPGTTDTAEVTLEKVTPTDSLKSTEAMALLLTGEPGEEDSEIAKSPGTGNEYLLVTLNFRNIKAKPPLVTPNDLKLVNGSGKEYKEVETGGYGGVYNMKQVAPGARGKVTAVYEVVKGETDLTLSYQPYGADACLFRVR